MDATGQQQLAIEQLLLYTRNHIRDIYYIPIVVAPIALGLHVWFSWTPVLLWVSATLITLLITTLFYRHIMRQSQEMSVEQYTRIYRTLIFIRFPYLLCWSTIVLWAWVPGSAENHVFQILISAGVIAITAMMSSPLKNILYYEMALSTFPLIIRFYHSGGVYWFMGLMAFWFALLMLSLGYEMRKAFTQILQLQFDNKYLIENLEHLATVDSLTNVHNRRSFFEQANKSKKYIERHQGSFGIVVVDVDYFKSINDNYGHAVGDEVLKSIAELLKNEVRETDTLGRLGGEEFAIVFMDVDTETLAELVARLIKSVSQETFIMGENRLTITVSAGITIYRNGDSIESMLHRADVAMYQAKDAGRNRFSIG